MQSFAILGSHADLSIAELSAITNTKPSLSTEDVAVFDDIDLELTKLQTRLGGTQKLGSIIASTKKLDHDELAELLASLLVAEGLEGKLTFGLSVYDLGHPPTAKALQQKRQALGLETKKKLKGFGHSARYVTSKNRTLSSVDVTKNKILERGAEFCFLVKKDEVLIGQTIAVQDYEDWSHRDYDRPARDAKRGMLPPKLARMMINLSGVEPTGHNLLDPFCGSGTVLMEGSMLGFEELIGSDLSEQAVADTKTNIDWLQQHHSVPEFTLHQSKAENVGAVITPESIDLVVTEPFLGTPRTGRESEDDILAAVQDLTELYKKSFAAIEKTMRKEARMVVAVPVHHLKEQAFPLPIKEIFEPLGLSLVQEPMLYRQPGQFVGRQISIFKKLTR